MGMWIQQQCDVCHGNGRLEIGRNEDRVMENREICPVCKGKGWLDINKPFWGRPHKRLTW